MALAGVVWALTRKVRAMKEERRRLQEEMGALEGRLAYARRELDDAMLNDPITGLRNRRYFAGEIEKDLERVRRAFSPQEKRRKNRDLVFYLVDIDHLRQVNEEFGQEAGDRLISELASRLSLRVRRVDSVVRWDGEVFLIVCRSCDRAEARIVADRILSAVSNEPFDLGEGRSMRRSCSVGWAPYPWFADSPEDVSWEDVLRLADRALDLAKKSGRNQAVGLQPSGVEADALAETRAAIATPLESGDWRSIRMIRSLGRETV